MEPARQAASYFLTGRADPPVKNTFIHFHVGTNDTESSAVLRANYHRSHSDPVHGEGSTSEHSTCGERSLSKQSSLHSLPQSGRAQGSSHMTSEVRSEARSSARSSSPSASGNSMYSEAEAAKSEDPDYAAGPPAPSRQGGVDLPPGISSIGALGHCENNCKPCAWNWKPGGCVNGRNCDFCHKCERGELKRRRKERVAVLRKSEKDGKRRMPKAGAVEGGRVGDDGSVCNSVLDSGSMYATASSGYENGSSASESAMSGIGSHDSSPYVRGAEYSSSRMAAMMTLSSLENVSTATVKKSTRISL